MAKVLIYNNFLADGQASLLAPASSELHRYESLGPGKWRANPYAKSKHINAADLLRRIIVCSKLVFRWRRYDVLIVDTGITGLLVSGLSLLTKGRRKLVISSFNVPRRRKGFWKWLAGVLYRRVDHFFVHSTYDIQLGKRLYNLHDGRMTFYPFLRGEPANGEPPDEFVFEDGRPFVMSFGGNARDYGTFFRAIENTDLSAIVVARQYNLENLEAPANVKTFCNIPLQECDRLLRKCLFTVFAFDGSEPSCGQISIVSSFMVGKPTICTDCTGVRDYVTDGVNGLLARTGDADDLRSKMVQLCSDHELYNRLSDGARSWAQQNSDPVALQSRIENLVTSLTDAK